MVSVRIFFPFLVVLEKIIEYNYKNILHLLQGDVKIFA